MIISKINYYHYKMPFRTPLFINKVKSKHREGIFIEIRDEQGNTGLGEIAPLPGLHVESLESVTARLHVIFAHLIGNPLPEELELLNSVMEGLFLDMQLSPSAECATSLALLDLLAKRKQVPLYMLFNLPFSPHVPVNGLLKGSPGEVLDQARVLVASGYTTLKLKVGLWPVQYDIQLVNQLAELLGDTVNLRLDANRKWSMETALQFADGIAGCPIEYIEEPVINPDDIELFHKKTGLPVALDESLTFFTAGERDIPEWITALILKPIVLGNIFKTIYFIELAKKHHVKPVITSAYESSLTLKALAQIAAVFLPMGTAVGLDTQKFLMNDVLQVPFKTDDGFIDVSSPDIQNNLLKQVYGNVENLEYGRL